MPEGCGSVNKQVLLKNSFFQPVGSGSEEWTGLAGFPWGAYLSKVPFFQKPNVFFSQV